jgi:filamentous hemagglutinin family protein
MESKYKHKTLFNAFILATLAAYAAESVANSTIVVDGSLPTSHNLLGATTHDLSGSGTLSINGNTDGVIVNHNLFFSFSQFGVGSGDTAQFSCPGCISLNNVISRITGNLPTIIEGNLVDTIPNANFWLLNPNGVMFGHGAVLDVPASLHVSNASRLSDGNGLSYFSANLHDSGSSLFISPHSFGFTGTESGGITLQGATITAGTQGIANIEINGSTILVQANSDPAVVNTLNAASSTLSSPGAINIDGAIKTSNGLSIENVSSNGELNGTSYVHLGPNAVLSVTESNNQNQNAGGTLNISSYGPNQHTIQDNPGSGNQNNAGAGLSISSSGNVNNPGSGTIVSINKPITGPVGNTNMQLTKADSDASNALNHATLPENGQFYDSSKTANNPSVEGLNESSLRSANTNSLLPGGSSLTIGVQSAAQ